MRPTVITSVVGARAPARHDPAGRDAAALSLPPIDKLSLPDTASEALRAAWSAAQSREPSAWSTPPRVLAAEVLRAHPGSRWTFRYRLQPAGDTPPVSCVAKVYARDRADVAAVLWRLHAAGGERSGTGWSGAGTIPRPLAYLPALHLLLVEDVPGETLRRAARHSPILAAARAARWLGRYHSAHVPPPDAYDLRNPMLVARRRARRLATAAPELGTACAEVLARLALATPCWPPPPERLRVLHGDFGLDHLILGPGVCAAIDWDDWRVGDPAEDAGRLLASLRHAATRHPEWASAADRAALMFRRVYLAMTPQAAEHLAFYESLDCLRVARRAAQHGDPAGRARAAVMLAAAANALGQG